jgi:hypothetical protein
MREKDPKVLGGPTSQTRRITKKMKALSVCGTLELGLNEVNEAVCALYIRHHYNPAVVENFLGDEFFGANRAATMKERT